MTSSDSLPEVGLVENDADELFQIASFPGHAAIYNPEYELVKDKLNRQFDRETGSDSTILGFEGWRTLYRAGLDAPMYVNGAPGWLKKLRTASGKLDQNGISHDFMLLVLALGEKWAKIAETFAAQKGRVVSGRRPSGQPPLTPPRTLENTGTCAVCGRNVKIPGGAIYDHGFTLRFGGRQDKCPGVGYPPIEVSPIGAQRYLEALRSIRVQRLAGVESLRRMDPNAFLDTVDGNGRPRKVIVRNALVNAESELRYLERDVATYEKIVREWKPRELPKA